MTSGLFQSASTGLTSLSCIGIQPRAFPTVLFCTWLSLKSYSKLLVNLMQSKYAVLIHYLTEALLHSFTQLHIIAATTLFHMRTSLLDACCILCTMLYFAPNAYSLLSLIWDMIFKLSFNPMFHSKRLLS